MPNWCFNKLVITGDEDRVKQVKEQLGRPIKAYQETFRNKQKPYKVVTIKDPVLSFQNICMPPADKIKKYWLGTNNPEYKEEGIDWYSYNNENWGTKWDVANSDGTFIEDDSPGIVSYRFDTAWAPPVPAMEKLSVQYPDLEITLHYEEESGWGGTMVIKNGKGEETSSYEWRCASCGEKYDSYPERTEQMQDEDTCPECEEGTGGDET